MKAAAVVIPHTQTVMNISVRVPPDKEEAVRHAAAAAVGQIMRLAAQPAVLIPAAVKAVPAAAAAAVVMQHIRTVMNTDVPVIPDKEEAVRLAAVAAAGQRMKLTVRLADTAVHVPVLHSVVPAVMHAAVKKDVPEHTVAAIALAAAV